MKIIWKATPATKGGSISFSLVVNALASDLEDAQEKTEKNYLQMDISIAKICRQFNVSGFSLIKQSGQYFSPEGQTFQEESFRMELIGITTDQLEGVAESICEAFNQRSVLINNYNTSEIYRITT